MDTLCALIACSLMLSACSPRLSATPPGVSPSATLIDIGAKGDEAYVGEGLWNREGPRPDSRMIIPKQDTFRWTNNAFKLTVPVTPNRYNRVTWRAMVPDYLMVSVGEWQTLLPARSKDTLIHTFVIPAAVIGDRKQVTIEARAMKPREAAGPNHRRTLVAMLDKVWIEPTDELSEWQPGQAEDATEPTIPPIDRIRGVETRPHVSDPVGFAMHLKLERANVVTLGIMNGRGLIYHPTKYGVTHPLMDPTYLPAVIKELRSRDIAVLGWALFNIQDVRRSVEEFEPAKKFPQWTMKFIDTGKPPKQPAVGMCLVSSPYIEQHAKVLRESAALDIDGFFLDGFYFHGLPNRKQAGCTCEFCRKAFKIDTGLELPAKVNWTDATFKRWVRWRNHRLHRTAKYFKQQINEVNPKATVTFNYNLWPFGGKDWETGIAMWRVRDFGVSQHGYTGKFSQKWLMLGFKSRLGRDINPAQTDIWRTGEGSVTYGAGEANLDWQALEMTTFLLSGLSHGIIPWHGRMSGPVALSAKVHGEAAKRERYFSRKHIADVGVLLSQNTFDFWGHQPGTINLLDYQDSVLGTWMILSEHHVPFEFVFENQLNAKELAWYRTLVLPNTAAMSEKDMATIAEWVRSGGNLVTTGVTGRFNEWGDPTEQTLQKTLSGLEQTGIVAQPLGSGFVTHLPDDPGLAWARQRDDESAEVMLSAIRRSALPIEVIAPSWVCVNQFENPKDPTQRWVHLLNVSHLMPDGDAGFRGLKGKPVERRPADKRQKGRTVGGPVVPAKGITLKLRGVKPTAAKLAIADQPLKIDTEGRIHIPELGLHDIVVIDLP